MKRWVDGVFHQTAARIELLRDVEPSGAVWRLQKSNAIKLNESIQFDWFYLFNCEGVDGFHSQR